MLHRIILASLLVTLLLSGSVANAQSLSERLEKGIYTEETVGDLAAAMDIYEQIVEDARNDRAVAAEAQFRLGQCLLKKDMREEAMAAFKKVIEDFADQEELVAQARVHVPDEPDFEMQPVPWKDGESIQLRAELATGLWIGTFVLSVNSAQENGEDLWVTNLGRYVFLNAPNQGISRVRTNRSTFRPLNSLFRHSILGTIEGTYSPTSVSVHSVGRNGRESTKEHKLDGLHYDNEQAMQLFRRLPLAENFKTKVPIFATMGSGAISIEVEVTAIEKVTVPAGEFECYRLLIPMLQQTFWITTDENRYLVKFEAGGVSAKMESVRVNKPGELVEYQDEQLGFTMSAPADWRFVQHTDEDGEDDKVIHLLLDPEALSMSKLVAKAVSALSDEERESVRALAESRIEDDPKAYQDFKVRPDSWVEYEVDGQPAVSFIADFVVRDRKMVRYFVYVLGKKTAAEFSMKIERDQFSQFQEPFNAIANSFREGIE